MTERERGPTRDSPQPMLTEMGPRTSNGGGPDAADDTEEELQPVLTDMGPPTSNGGGPDAADDTEGELHHLSVYETDPPRDESAAPKRRNRIVVQIHGHVRLRTRTQLLAGTASSSRARSAIPGAAGC